MVFVNIRQKQIEFLFDAGTADLGAHLEQLVFQILLETVVQLFFVFYNQLQRDLVTQLGSELSRV